VEVADVAVDVVAAAVDVVVVKFLNQNAMKKTKYRSLVYLPALFMLPCTATYFLYSQWFPFGLSGRHFLVFFLMYMGLGYGIIFLCKHYRADRKINVVSGIIGLTIILSLARIIQGTYHHKPIGFLLLLTAAHIIILVLLNKKTDLPKNGREVER
jgi:hypothetical protein